MAKQVARSGIVEIKAPDSTEWVDISSQVCGFKIDAQIGDVVTVDLSLVDRGDGKIIADAPNKQASVSGVDLRNHCYGVDFVLGSQRLAVADGGGYVENRLSPYHVVTLHLHADSDVLRINGMHPWEE